MGAEAFPLQWPEGWPRTKYRQSDRKFGGSVYGLTMGRSRDRLLSELKLLGASTVVISSNVQLRGDGLPYSQQRKIDDPGVAVYFMFKKRQMVMAADKYDSPAGNLRSLSLAIEGMRQLERHGGGHMMEKAFAGFAALPSPDSKKSWRDVFGVQPDWRGDLAALYREKARTRHPDVGGNDVLMSELNVAYKDARQELGNG